MQQVSFSNEMTKSKRMVSWITLSLFVLGVASVLMLIFGKRPWLVAVEIVSGIALVLFLLTLAFLLSFFLSRPEVKEKSRLSSALKRNLKDITATQTDLASALQQKKAASETYEEQKTLVNEKHSSAVNSVQQKIQETNQSLEQQLRQALEQIQREHIETGLKAVTVDPAHVPGIGDMLTEKLRQNGVSNAFDVSAEAIQSIPGFGESKALSLIRWRESLENTLRAEQPASLPEEAAENIRSYFAQQKQTLETELGEAQQVQAQALDKLRATESQNIVNAEVKETTARQNLANLETQKQEFHSQIAQYKQINFPRFVLSILAGIQANWKNQTLAYLIVGGFLALGIVHVALLIWAVTL